jgi:hypothetical protein
MNSTLRVKCADEVLVPYRGPDGTLVRGRYFGRAADRTPLPDGEVVTVTAANRNAVLVDVRNGHLALAGEE